VPNPIALSLKHEPLDIFYSLGKPGFDRDPRKKKVKDEILQYLRKIGFPEHGAYKN
jgi:hypothetical protein